MNLIPVGYTFLFIAIGFSSIVGIILLSNKPKWNDWAAFVIILLALFVGWNIVRPRQTQLREGAQQVQSLIGAGKPVLLEFQSPYCVACITIKPAVDELEEEVGDQVHIIRLNIQDEIGKDLLPIYGFQFTPTFIFFDEQGDELWRMIGEFNPQRVHDSLNE